MWKFKDLEFWNIFNGRNIEGFLDLRLYIPYRQQVSTILGVRSLKDTLQPFVTTEPFLRELSTIEFVVGFSIPEIGYS